MTDGGAQPERTVLAWVRTALALAGAGLLCVRLAPSHAGAILGAVVVCGAAALLISHLRRLRIPLLRLRRPPAHENEMPAEAEVSLDPRLAAGTTAVTIVVGVLGLILALG